MAAKLIFLFFVFILLLYKVKPDLDNVGPLLTQLTDGFNAERKSMCLDDAVIDNNGILRLTNESVQVDSHAFYKYPIKFKNSSNGKVMSFSTTFAFALINEHGNQGRHHFAFTISPSGALLGPYLGRLKARNDGNISDRVFTVAFTVIHPKFSDIDDNHVDVGLKYSIVSNKSVRPDQSLRRKNSLTLKSGHVIQAWVEYDARINQLNVSLAQESDRPKSAFLSYNVDLSPIFKESMFIGFLASTDRPSSNSHYVLGWSFNINGDAKNLNLDQLRLKLPKMNGSKKNRTGLIVGVSVSSALVVILGIVLVLYNVRKLKKTDVVEAWEIDIGPHRFSYEDLKKATKGFGDKELLGSGGFGRVYKGTLPNSNTQVAVKRVSQNSKQGLREFVSEVGSIGHLRHRNLVQLLGWCRKQDDLLLVYEFMPNLSLDKYLFDEPKAILSWEQRFKIIKGVALGLLYLHEEWEQTVVHRDIKAGNVLLDSEFNGKLSDFGLAKLYERGSNPSTTRVVGTLGYLAPELTRIGKPTTSSDVFAFGALLLEVVCGRRPIDPKALPEELMLVEWVWEKWSLGATLDVVDSRLGGEFDEVEAVLVLKLGLMCSNDAPESRPTMRHVVRCLETKLALEEDFMQSYPTTSASVGDNEDIADVEDVLTASFSVFSGDNGS
ncbi:L-type lectin-domain containing receptor kinase S.4-like [Quercus robur]|uniref:L-type lectin-domain containing receptor kinase S.4-like n=1 Tax=Quercus robur TaxID=38942 RepID=UPI002163FD6B|nr:L-type lectin-domain containing receptor kinase S.4-like [Quercus robur]